ncbi:MAG: SCO family protein [Gemmataceae bacterium]
MTRLWHVALLAVLAAVSPCRAAAEDLLASREKFFTPHLGDRVPLDLTFKDETGKTVQLGDYGKTRPLILVLAYYKCPMLCTLVLNDLVSGLRGVPFTAGNEYEVVVVSFDPREKPELAAAKKESYVEEYGRPGGESGWHFLTGEQPEIDRLMEAVGFRAVWDEKGQQFAHARGIMILTSDWMVTRYFLDGAFPPRDLRMALVEASEGKVGSPMDRILLMCFNYNPVTAKYSVTILNIVRMGGAVVVSLLLSFWALSWYRGRSRRAAVAAVGPVAGADEAGGDTPRITPS